MWPLLLILACHTPSSSTDKGTDTRPPLDSTLVEETSHAALREAIEAAGFTVREGHAQRLETEQCCDWESCFAFNPDNRYASWQLPRAPGQLVANPNEEADGRSGTFRMDPQEVILAILPTPPEARYYSYRTYVHDRWNGVEREWAFQSLGDTLNDRILGTRGGARFLDEAVVLTVADQGSEATIRQVLNGQGYPDTMINLDIIPAELTELGLHDEADTIRMQHRLSLFTDEAAGQAWLDRLPEDALLWRLTPTESATPRPYSPPALRPVGTGTNEDAWLPALDALEQGILTTYADYEPHIINSGTGEQDEDTCALGCNRDTWLAGSYHFLLPPGTDSFLMVYGVNHEATGKSVYSNAAVYGVEHMVGVSSLNSRDMPGTARAYLSDPKVDDLYAWKLARSCDPLDVDCVVVPTTCPGVPALGQGNVLFRAYVEESTATGPSTEELLVDRILLFTRPKDPGSTTP